MGGSAGVKEGSVAVGEADTSAGGEPGTAVVVVEGIGSVVVEGVEAVAGAPPVGAAAGALDAALGLLAELFLEEEPLEDFFLPLELLEGFVKLGTGASCAAVGAGP